MTDFDQRLATLSHRQKECLRLVADHLQSKQIARRLGLRPATVDSHIATALQKLHMSSRREAALAILAAERVDRSPMPDLIDRALDNPAPKDNVRPEPAGMASGRRRRKLILTQSDAGGGGDRDAPRPRAPDRGEPWRPSWRPPKSGMQPVIVRYLLDGLYVSLFFAVMSAVAFGSHLVVLQCEASHVDHTVLLILKGVHYLLVGIDGVGVVTATGFLTFRFILAIKRADD